MSFFDVALWKFFSIRSMAQRSALRCSSCSDAELALEPPEAASAPTSTPTAIATTATSCDDDGAHRCASSRADSRCSQIRDDLHMPRPLRPVSRSRTRPLAYRARWRRDGVLAPLSPLEDRARSGIRRAVSATSTSLPRRGPLQDGDDGRELTAAGLEPHGDPTQRHRRATTLEIHCDLNGARTVERRVDALRRADDDPRDLRGLRRRPHGGRGCGASGRPGRQDGARVARGDRDQRAQRARAGSGGSTM